MPSHPSNMEHPVALGSFRSWVSLLRHSGGIDHAYVPRALFVSLTTLVTAPLRLWERLRYGAKIRSTRIHPSPIFIIGHWRSGTTHLHNLMCQDPRLGFLSTFQAMAPGFCLVGRGRIQRMLAAQAAARYPTRLIDNIPLAFDAPQEDEFALASLFPLSFLHAFSFPRRAEEFFDRYVLFDDISDAQKERWTRTYLALLRKVTLAGGGRRLVLKNCADTGRIQTLLELFPDAKFIHIHRNPYEVLPSALYMHRTVLPRSQVQEADPDRVETNVLRFYVRVLGRFLADKALIPSGNLVELRYDELERRPMEQLQRIYDELGLGGFDDARAAFEAYLRSIAGYRTNSYEVDAETIGKVNDHWGFAFDVWGYDRLEPQPILEAADERKAA